MKKYEGMTRKIPQDTKKKKQIDRQMNAESRKKKKKLYMKVN